MPLEILELKIWTNGGIMVSPQAFISLAVRPSIPHDFDGDSLLSSFLMSSYNISLNTKELSSFIIAVCSVSVSSILLLNLGPIVVK